MDACGFVFGCLCSWALPAEGMGHVYVEFDCLIAEG
jgi:hypothetical protein